MLTAGIDAIYSNAGRRMNRFIFVIALGIVLAISTVGSRGSTSTSPDSAEAASAGAIDKITGTITGTYHLGFTEYVQTYDAVTTANLVWEADPDYFAESCHCRPFFPTGMIDWSYRYHVVSESIDCDVTVGGQIAAGTGPKEEQMLVLWDDPADDTQYIFSGSGGVEASDSFYCEGEGTSTVNAVDFLGVPGPDEIVTTTPTFPAAAAQPAPAAVSAPLCDDAAPFKVPRDGQVIVGKCYGLNIDDGYTQEYVLYEWNLQVKPEPIIFIHGFLGSQIKCGGEELWPHVGGIDRPQLLKMALASDGISPANGACNATVGELVETVLGSSIYKTTKDFLNQLAPGRVYFFNWDWRKAPQQSLVEFDSFIQSVRALHDNAKVVLMAHSYGGLLARLYLGNAANTGNIARVVTIGTPALGSPKALFPLYAGAETPEMSPLDLLLDNEDLQEFAKNLAGDYYLYPSANYGPWLTVGGYPYPPPLGQQGVLDYVTSLGGNAALLNDAMFVHANVLDTPYVGTSSSDPKFEIIVGTGVPTITGIQILPDGYVKISYGNGDGTVPAKSAARGALGSANPNKAHTYYSCRVEHVPLPGHSQITDAIDDFLKFGEDIDGLKTPCAFSGFQFRIFRLPAVSSAVSGSGIGPTPTPGPGGPMSIDDAVFQGMVDYLDLPNEKFVIAGGDIPEIALPEGAFLEVTPLSEDSPDGKGQPTVYGPLNGQATISVSAGGALVLSDGQAAPLHGDVDCNEQVTPLDALRLLLHAAGTPLSPPGGCAAIGSGATPFGDLDCNNSVTALDALADLQIVAAAPLDFLAGCL